MSLSAMQIEFGDLIVRGYNATKAAIKAGYSEKTARAAGCKMIDERYFPEVVAYIAEERAKLAEKKIIDPEWVLQGFIREAENPDNKTTDRIKARELAGKMIGCFEERLVIRAENIDPADAANKMNAMIEAALARKEPTK